MVYYVLLWTLYSYSDEVMNKVSYVQDHRTQKELQQLKAILNLLVPRVVRTSDFGQKKFSAFYESGVSVVYIELAEFDRLTQELPGRKLQDLLDKIHRRLDDLAERHGLLRLETWSGCYVACVGLKAGDSEVVSRTVGEHRNLHSSCRVVQFALEASSFIAA